MRGYSFSKQSGVVVQYEDLGQDSKKETIRTIGCINKNWERYDNYSAMNR